MFYYLRTLSAVAPLRWTEGGEAGIYPFAPLRGTCAL